MKRLVLITLVLSLNLLAHSQTPVYFGGEKNKLDTISMKQVKIVPIHVQNLNSYEQQYYLEVDGEFIGVTDSLRPSQVIKLDVPVRIIKENELELHKVCTISIPKDKDELFKTKICTKALLYWMKE